MLCVGSTIIAGTSAFASPFPVGATEATKETEIDSSLHGLFGGRPSTRAGAALD